MSLAVQFFLGEGEIDFCCGVGEEMGEALIRYRDHIDFHRSKSLWSRYLIEVPGNRSSHKLRSVRPSPVCLSTACLEAKPLGAKVVVNTTDGNSEGNEA